MGDELIVASANIISDVFKKSPIFRIGGDEFLVILQNGDLENHKELFEQFEAKCANTFIGESAKLPVRIAFGFARFEPGRDLHFKDVFKRADDAMYENKRMGKME